MIVQSSFSKYTSKKPLDKILKGHIEAVGNNWSIANLTYGPGMAKRLYMGYGLTAHKPESKDLLTGTITNEDRTPGYPLFVVAANFFNPQKKDLVQIASYAVWAQSLVYILAFALLTTSLFSFLPFSLSFPLGWTLSFIPHSLPYTQADSLTPSLYCVTLAIHIFILTNKNKRKWLEVVFHLIFAFLFSVRPDFLVLWMGQSLVLHWQHKRRLLLPLGLASLIGISWGLYKMQYSGEFIPTTSTKGHVAFVGLWQAPNHKFKWKPSDSDYEKWLKANTKLTYLKGVEAQKYSMQEVFRFYATFPFYTVNLIGFKFDQYFRRNAMTGVIYPPYSPKLRSLFHNYGLGYIFLLAIFFNLWFKPTDRIAWLLSSPLLLSLPFFTILQNSYGRFVYHVTISLWIAGVYCSLMLFINRDEILKRYSKAFSGTAIVLIFFTLLFLAKKIEHYPDIRYSTPFLDPKLSSLNQE